MTAEEIKKKVDGLKNEARLAARRRMFPSGMTGDTSSVVNEARLTIMEDTIAGILAIIGGYKDSTLEQKIGLMLIDHWEKVVMELGGS